MANVGVLSKDVITKTRIIEMLEDQGHSVTMINGSMFDGSAFDQILVDLEDPMALLVIKTHGQRCLAFGSASDMSKLKQAEAMGASRVAKHGEFFKKILPKFVLK
jgi:hypothetical protein